MNRHRRTRFARLPYFKPLEDLRPGDPFRPFKSFTIQSVNDALLSSTKLRPGAKVVWMVLANQCHSSGHDQHTQANLAEMAGLSLTQFRHHLARLLKLKMVHSEPELGRENWHWLLFHPLFANCSPWTPSETRWGGTREPEEGVLGNPITQSTYQSTYTSKGTPAFNTGTSSRGSDAQKGGEKAKANGNGKALAAGADNKYSVHSAPPISCQQNGESLPPIDEAKTPLLKANAKRSWNTLEKQAQANRYAHAVQLANRIQYFRRQLNDANAAIGRQARIEMYLAMDLLSDAGFYLP